MATPFESPTHRRERITFWVVRFFCVRGCGCGCVCNVARVVDFINNVCLMLMQCEQAPSIPTSPTSQSDILSQQSLIQHLWGFYDKRINGVID